jgi:hypothetical protein
VDHFYGGGFFGNFRSVDNGLSWGNIGNGIPLNTGGFTIKVIGTNNVFIGNNKGIYFSNNKGNTFIDAGAGLDPEPNNSVQGIEANSTFLFAGLPGNGVWRRRLSDFGISMPLTEQIAKMDQQNKPEGILKNKLRIYPNPAINEATIQYEINGACEVRLMITDQSGKVVLQYNEFLTTGVYTKTIDAKHFSPGMYVVQVNVNGKADFAKFIIIR